MPSAHKDQIAQAFGRGATRYDRAAPLQKQIAERLSSFLPDKTFPPGHALHVLEIGCGTGFLTACLTRLYPEARLHITDIAPAMAEACAQKFAGRPHMRFDVMDGENPHLPDAPYDLIVSSMCVQWFTRPAESLRALTRYLAPGGTLCYATTGRDCLAEWRQSADALGLSAGLLDAPEWPGLFTEEHLPRRYAGGMEFLRSLKTIGAHRPRDGHLPLSGPDLKKLVAAYDRRYNGDMTWHIVYGRLTAPETAA